MSEDRRLLGNRADALLKQTLQDDEDLVLVIRMKWVRLVVPILVLILAFVAAMAIVVYLPQSVSFALRSYASVAVLVIGLGYFLYKWILWREEFIIITSKRVVLERGVFSRTTREIPLNKINDVLCRQSVLGRLLHYGNLEIASANATLPEILSAVPDPLSMRSTLASASVRSSVPNANHSGSRSDLRQDDTSRHKPTTLVGELERLSEMYRDGMISETEFRRAKNLLLDTGGGEETP